MSTELSIHRALQKVKTLTDRIESTISTQVVIGVVRGNQEVVSFPERQSNLDKEKLSKMIIAEHQSVMNLIDERQKIKSAIEISNAVTKVVVSGVTMTVRAAIEMKTTMKFKESLLQTMKHSNARAAQIMTTLHNQKDEEIQRQTSIVNGKASTAKITEADSALIERAAANRFEPKVVDPLDLNTKIKELELEISEFLADIDATLSESNAKTMIQI